MGLHDGRFFPYWICSTLILRLSAQTLAFKATFFSPITRHLSRSNFITVHHNGPLHIPQLYRSVIALYHTYSDNYFVRSRTLTYSLS